MVRRQMRARLIPFALLALLAPLLTVIALHRSGAPLLQPRLTLSVWLPAQSRAGPQPAELRSTYRARRCLPFLTCRADWSGGPARPIEVERRRKVELGPGGAASLEVPRTLLSLASFELVGMSLRLGAMSTGGRVDLLLAPPRPGDSCALSAPGGEAELQVSRACERIELQLGSERGAAEPPRDPGAPATP
jgi:hypothetical protein